MCNEFPDDTIVYSVPKRVQAKLDRYARWLCFLCSFLDMVDRDPTCGAWQKLIDLKVNKEHGNSAKELQRWWEDHQRHDAARRAEEKRARKRDEIVALVATKARLRKAALDKLTKPEREALGL